MARKADSHAVETGLKDQQHQEYLKELKELCDSDINESPQSSSRRLEEPGHGHGRQPMSVANSAAQYTEEFSLSSSPDIRQQVDLSLKSGKL